MQADSENRIAIVARERTSRTDVIDTPLVDVHAHVYHSGMPLSASAWRAPAAEAKLDDFLATLDSAGVHFAVLAAASIFEDYNDYMLEAVRKHKRLRTTVIVSPDVSLETLRAMDRDGVVGIRLQFRSLGQLPDLSDFAYRKLFQRLADLGWHVHLHDEGERLAHSIRQIERSGVRLVIDHFGRPDLSLGVNSGGFLAVLRAVDRGNTWVKLSASFRLTPAEKLQPFTDGLVAAGADRLFWGSDWPFVAHEKHMTYAQAIADYHALVPDHAVRAQIDRTALKFYFS
jgi:predicted TIM-barrel fold metal-dependent hydrolase